MGEEKLAKIIFKLYNYITKIHNVNKLENNIYPQKYH